MTTKSARTVLLCDAAFSALPILFALRRRGFQVAVCGSRSNDPGHELADLAFRIDYSDDQLLFETVRGNSIDYLVPGCTDVSYLSCAKVAKRLGLPGYDRLEAVDIIHRKDAFRSFCRERNFSIPRFTVDEGELPTLHFPILIKPSDSFSGKGIVKVQSYDSLPWGIQQARSHSFTQSILFEEFVDAPLYSHSAIIRAGKVVLDFFVNEYCTVNPYQVNSSHVSVDLPTPIVGALRNWLEDFAQQLSLVDGLVHTQFLATDSAFYLIEVTRRCPGDLYASLIEKSVGLDYAFAYSAAFCEEEPARTVSDQKVRRFYSRHTVSVDRDCIFLSASLALRDCDASYVPLKKTGEVLRAAPLDRAGIYFIQHNSASRMAEITPTLRDYVVLQTK